MLHRENRAPFRRSFSATVQRYRSGDRSARSFSEIAVAGRYSVTKGRGLMSREITRRTGSNTRSRLKVAVILGASRGLGYLVARELLHRGYAVAISARSSDGVEAAARKLGKRAHGYVCDVSSEASVNEFVDAVERDLGPIDVAIHVAGVMQVGPLQATRLTHFTSSLDVMLYGPIHAALAILPRMTERGRGRFGVVASVGGRVAAPRMLAYTTAKFGVMGLVEGLATELAGTGVTATALIPGLMRTGSATGASFFGSPRKQFAWFTSLASLPVISVSGKRAARLIVKATLRGRPIGYVGMSARLASLVHGIAPALFMRVTGMVSRALPRGNDPQLTPGSELRGSVRNPLMRLLLVRADRAAARSNQP